MQQKDLRISSVGIFAILILISLFNHSDNQQQYENYNHPNDEGVFNLAMRK